jgi:hypothetical protein
MTHRDAVNQLRGIADAVNRPQPKPTPKQRRAWADGIWAACDALEQPETPCDTLPDVTQSGWGKAGQDADGWDGFRRQADALGKQP